MLVAFCKRKNKVIAEKKAAHYCLKKRRCDGLKLNVKESRRGDARMGSFQQAANMQRKKWKPPKR